MPANTSPDNIVYPLSSDPIAPLNTVFQDLANSVQNALTGPTAGYRFRQTLVYNTAGTSSFTKATYPWLRAIRVRMVGGGGGGGGCAATAAGQNAIARSGGGGAYSESFITNIAGLAASVTVTVGAAGTGGAAGNNGGVAGGQSSFGALVTAPGGTAGSGGPANTTPGFQGANAGASVGTGDIAIGGQPAEHAYYLVASAVVRPNSGGSMFGSRLRGAPASGNGANATVADQGYGVGGTGGANIQSDATARSGGSGTQGLVIIDLFA